MKRTILITLAALAMSMALPGQVINVTSPTASDNWCIGSTYSISWTRSGTMPNTVTIRLRRAGSDNSDPAVEVIAPETDNTNSSETLRWLIPASVGAGRYFIRVKTVGSPEGTPEVSGDSPDFSISTCASSGASITVTEPNGGSSWRPGSNHTVTWTKSGTMGSMVSITLRREGAPESEAPAARIVDGCANNGSRMWFISDSLAEGRYFVRIKTTDDVIGNSAVFTISATGAGSEPATADSWIQSDLELAGVGVEYHNGHIVAWVKNNGPDALASHDVKFRLNFVESGAGEQIITKRLSIPVGQERSVELQDLAANDIPDAGLRTAVRIDTSGSHIRDTHMTNQHRDVRLALLDISCGAPRADLSLHKIYGSTFNDFRVEFKIRVRHNLAREMRNIHCHWELSGPDGGEIETYDRTIGTLGSGQEYVWEVNETYGKEGASGSKRPRLREGTTYRIRAYISDPGDAFYDVNPGNDSYSFTFSFPD